MYKYSLECAYSVTKVTLYDYRNNPTTILFEGTEHRESALEFVRVILVRMGTIGE